MIQESKVLTEELEDSQKILYGEIRSDIDINMNNFSLQINIFDNERGKKEKKNIQSKLFEFIFYNLKKSLDDTEWEYLKPTPFGIFGVNDKKIKKGEVFNNKDEIFAVSQDGKNITSKIVVTGDEVNTQQEGVYNLTYSVEDDLKNKIEIKRKITVENIEELKDKEVKK